MKLAIMQPYLFPYIGYFQLIHSVDNFIIFDDVNYIKQGWINRNSILLDDEKYRITFKVSGASSYKKINEIDLCHNREKLLKTIKISYLKAPYFNTVFPLLEDIIYYGENNLAKYIENSLLKLSSYLDINTTFILSSELYKNNELNGQDKIINICKSLKATTYINSIGGMELYQKEVFGKNDIQLFYLKSKDIQYEQFSNEFVPNLSIIDVMMFNSVEKIKLIIEQYDLI